MTAARGATDSLDAVALPSLVRARFVSTVLERPPAPPLGLQSWCEPEQARDVVVELESPLDDTPGIQAAIARIPPASQLVAGAVCVVLAVPASCRTRRGVRAFFREKGFVTRAVRASALLAQGYVHIAAGFDPASRTELVWGVVPTDAEQKTCAHP